MLLRLPLQFTTLLQADLKPSTSTLTRDPFDVKDYVNSSLLNNSGAAGVWSLRTDCRKSTAQELYETGQEFQQIEREVGLCVLDLERYSTLYGTTRLFFDWAFSELVFRSPALNVGPYNPIISITPVLRNLDNGVGRGVVLNNKVKGGNLDAPNWLWASSSTEFWEIPGALGSTDIDETETQEFNLFDVQQKATDTFRFELSENVRRGLLDRSYSGLRISLRYSEDDLNRIFSDSSVDLFEGQTLQFANQLSRGQLLSPYVELGSLELKLDHSSNFIVDETNFVGINFSRFGVPTLPIETTQSGVEVRALLIAELSLFYETFELVLNDVVGTPAPLATIVPNEGRLEADVFIFPDFLDRTLVDLLGLTTELDFSVLPPGVYDGSELNYDHPQFYEFWHSDANADYRRDKRFVDVLGKTTLREALLEGSSRFKIALKVFWQVVGEDYEGTGTYENERVLGKTELAVRDYDPFGVAVGTLVNDLYPRITTIGLKRLWNKAENPQKIQVFIDDRPSQQMANATLNRSLNVRTSGLYDDLSWGVVQGAQIGAGAWFIEPSEHTLCSHDGRYHWFWFDPSNLPRGSWRFEFVRLNAGARLRQINAVDFSIS